MTNYKITMQDQAIVYVKAKNVDTALRVGYMKWVMLGNKATYDEWYKKIAFVVVGGEKYDTQL